MVWRYPKMLKMRLELDFLWKVGRVKLKVPRSIGVLGIRVYAY